MRLFELLEKVYSHNINLPRRIKFRGTIYVIKPGENYTYYEEGKSHTETMKIDTYYLDEYVEILEDNTNGLKEEIKVLSDKLEALNDQLDNVREALDNLD